MLRRLLLLTITLFLFIALPPFSAAQADCDFSISNYARAVQLHDMGDYDRALRHYQCALLEDPDDAIIPILIENVYEDIASAPSAWARRDGGASATDCDPALDHARLGGEAHDAGDDLQAEIHLQCVLLADTAHVDALYRMGMIHINRGETHEAKHYFDRAERAATEARSADEDLLTVLLGADARSVIDVVELRQLRLTSPDPGESGEYLRPRHHYRKTVLRVIWRRQGQKLDETRSADRATDGDRIRELERAQAQDPTRVDLRCELGRLYMARGDYAAAFGQFYPLISERLGDHCGNVNRLEERQMDGLMSASELEQALKQDPKRVDLRCELGRQYQARGNYAGAFHHFSYLIHERLGDHCRFQG